MADAGSSTSDPGAESLSELRAAQLRTRVARGALVKIALGMLFLVGALAHALAPQRHEQTSLLWITGLALLSTFNVGTGLRRLTRVGRLREPLWLLASAAWGLLSVVLLGLLLRR